MCYVFFLFVMNMILLQPQCDEGKLLCQLRVWIIVFTCWETDLLLLVIHYVRHMFAESSWGTPHEGVH